MDFIWLGIQICMMFTDTLKRRQRCGLKNVSIWCYHHLLHVARHLLHIELIRLLTVACGTWSHSLNAVRSWWYLRELEHDVVHVDPEHPKHAQWMTCMSMQAMEELWTDPCVMGLCVIMLKHELMAADEFHDNRPQDLVMVSPHIQMTINKMQLCSLSVAYALPIP